jgi:hypothetical protein
VHVQSGERLLLARNGGARRMLFASPTAAGIRTQGNGRVGMSTVNRVRRVQVKKLSMYFNDF